jgi:hypothetical protein
MTIRFQDLDPQLLTSSPEEPLSSSFPQLVDELTIDILELLADSTVSMHFPPPLLQSIEVVTVHLSSQTLDAVITLSSGAAILYRLDAVPAMYRDEVDNEIICLENVTTSSERRFHPTLMVLTQHGGVSTLAISDIGLSSYITQNRF